MDIRESAREAVRVVEECGSIAAASRKHKIPRSTLRTRLEAAARYGLDGSVPKELPEGQRVKGVSTLYGEDGAVKAQWVKSVDDGPSDDRLAEILQEAFRTCKGGAKLRPPPKSVRRGRLSFNPVADLHMGVYCWGPEVGNNWSLERAMTVYRDAFQEVTSASPSCEECIILGGGDQMHSDNSSNKTERGGNALDVDGRYDKVLIETCHLFVFMVDISLQKHGKVRVRILKGNHDPHSSVALTYFLLAWYRNDPRVTVEASPDLFWWYRFGKVQLGATHGHEAKMKDMPGIMAHRQAKDWSVARHRFVHLFHIHHSSQSKTEHNGVVCESWQTPAPQDAWHYGCGFLSGRSMSAVIYDSEQGEIGRVRVGVEDDG